MLAWIRDKWDGLNLFRKLFLACMLFLAVFSLLGEGMEHLVSDVLYGNGQMLSDGANILVWLMCIFAAAVMVCFVIVLLTKKLVGNFTSVIERLSNGDEKARISDGLARRRDEIGLLARAFNSMASRRELEEDRQRMLLASVSHELRSPLTRLSVALELLAMQGVDSAHLDRLRTETKRMEALVGSILDYSRIEMVRPEFASFDFAETVRGAADDLRYEMGAEGCPLSVSLPEHCNVVANAGMLEHAVDNVLRNALKHGGDGGIGIDLGLEDGMCRLCVSDHGPGVPESELENLFLPFFRVDSSRQRSSGGTGMGLAITEAILRSHQGRAFAFNRPEGGLCVVLEFPASRPAGSLL